VIAEIQKMKKVNAIAQLIFFIIIAPVIIRSNVARKVVGLVLVLLCCWAVR
jgi:uncharacterized membrane protein